MSDREAPWEYPLDDGGVLDPGDTLADPERTVRLRVHVPGGVEDEERRERDADAALSDEGSGAINRRHRRWIDGD
jgi:Trm5-related predicted tRNA methylase